MDSSTGSEHKYKEEIKNYWNERSVTFDDEIGHGGADRHECLLWQNHFKDILGEQRLSILDLGTGTGFIALNLAELGYQVTGIDLGDQMLEKARLNAQNKGLEVCFLLGDAEKPNFPDDSFDVLICRHLFWTLLTPDQTMLEWRRLLRKNGRIILIDGKKNPPSGDKPKVYTNVHGGKVYSDELVEQVQGVDVTVSQISQVLTKAGFTQITHLSLDDIAQYHDQRSKDKPSDVSSTSEVNMIIGQR